MAKLARQCSGKPRKAAALLAGVSAIALLAAGELRAATANWVRFANSGVEVYSGAGSRAARSAWSAAVAAEGAFCEALGIAGRPRRPLRIYIFPGEAEFRPFSVHQSASRVGYFLETADLDVIVYRSAGGSPDRVLLHELTHRVLHQLPVKLPPWLEEGIAELFSTARLGGKTVSLGDPLLNHVRYLETQPLLSAQDLLEITEASAQYQDSQRITAFYAQSWALAHLLRYHPFWRKGFQPFLERLTAGQALESAFRESFGREFPEAVAQAPGWVKGARFPIESRPREAWERTSAQSATAMSAEDRVQAQVELLLLLRRTEEARRMLAGAAREGLKGPSLAAKAGWIALAEGEYEEARREFSIAIENGSADPAVHYEFAMLLRHAGAAEEIVVAALRRAVSLGTDYVPALFQLAVIEMDQGRLVEGVKLLQVATSVEPRRFTLWQSLAYAHFYAGEPVAASEAAAAAMRVAGNEAEREQAEATLKLVRSPLTRQKSHRLPDHLTEIQPGVRIPPSWQNPKGDRTIRGVLVQVECQGEQAVLRIEANGERWLLAVSDPRKVEIEGAEGVETALRCGSLSMPVEAEFRSLADSRRGELTRLVLVPAP